MLKNPSGSTPSAGSGSQRASGAPANGGWVKSGNALLTMDNVIITPHALCWTDECFHEIAATALQSIVDVSLGKRPAHVVNRDVLGGIGNRAGAV